jgi:hypothetical protein
MLVEVPWRTNCLTPLREEPSFRVRIPMAFSRTHRSAPELPCLAGRFQDR